MSKTDNIKAALNIVIEKTATAGSWTIAGADKIKLRNEDV